MLEKTCCWCLMIFILNVFFVFFSLSWLVKHLHSRRLSRGKSSRVTDWIRFRDFWLTFPCSRPMNSQFPSSPVFLSDIQANTVLCSYLFIIFAPSCLWCQWVVLFPSDVAAPAGVSYLFLKRAVSFYIFSLRCLGVFSDTGTPFVPTFVVPAFVVHFLFLYDHASVVCLVFFFSPSLMLKPRVFVSLRTSRTSRRASRASVQMFCHLASLCSCRACLRPRSGCFTSLRGHFVSPWLCRAFFWWSSAGGLFCNLRLDVNHKEVLCGLGSSEKKKKKEKKREVWVIFLFIFPEPALSHGFMPDDEMTWKTSERQRRRHGESERRDRRRAGQRLETETETIRRLLFLHH